MVSCLTLGASYKILTTLLINYLSLIPENYDFQFIFSHSNLDRIYVVFNIMSFAGNLPWVKISFGPFKVIPTCNEHQPKISRKNRLILKAKACENVPSSFESLFGIFCLKSCNKIQFELLDDILRGCVMVAILW